MVNRKKKKGSSILITVGIFAMLSILIMSVLAMTTSGYSLRIKNNKRIENFYAADSGLEISQKVLHDYLGKVVKASLNKVDEYVKSKPDGKLSQSEKEEKFQEFFKDIILKGGTLKDDTGNVIEQLKTVKDEVELPSNYDSFKRDGKNIEIQSEIKSLKKDGTEIVIPIIPYKDIYKFSLNVKSNFIDKDNKDREVEVDFDILIPEYGKLLVRSKPLEVPSILNYIVGVDGDYIIDGTGAINVMGDMWVKGNKANKLTKYNKYDGGITIKNSQQGTEINWKGNIVTPATLKIENTLLVLKNARAVSNENPNEVLEQNIYAGNLIIENNQKQREPYFGKEHNVFVYNDFIMNGTENPISIKNYYGLNDINNINGKFGIDNTYKNHLDTSSSMLINNLTKNETYFNVENDAYILGASYLDLGDAYQTGQSTVINQLTRPYTKRNDNYIYKYKGNMHIADKNKETNESLSLGEKAALVEEYYNDETNSDELKLADGFVIKGNLYNVGAVLAKTKDKKGNFTGKINPSNSEKIAEKMEFIIEKQKEYVKEVFNMGVEGNYTQQDFWNNEVNNSVKDSFNWSEIEELAKTFNTIEGNILRLDPDGEKPIEERKSGIIHLVSDKSIDYTMRKAYNEANLPDKKELHPLGTYGREWINTTDKANIILNSTEKIIEIRSTEGNSKIEYEKDKIIYKVKIGSQPLLLISKGDIIYNDLNAVNHNMLISAGSVTQNVAPSGNIGNYATPSQANEIGYEVGQVKLINELFKFTLEDEEIMGEIGDKIFGQSKIITSAIEVSHLIKSKNWKLNK